MSSVFNATLKRATAEHPGSRGNILHQSLFSTVDALEDAYLYSPPAIHTEFAARNGGNPTSEGKKADHLTNAVWEDYALLKSTPFHFGSPPQTHKITRTSQSTPHGTNASSAPASLDEAKIKSSDCDSTPRAIFAYYIIKITRSKNSGGDAAGSECAAACSVRRRRSVHTLGPRNSRLLTCARTPSSTARYPRHAECESGQKVCGGARAGGRGMGRGGWEEKRKEKGRCGAGGWGEESERAMPSSAVQVRVRARAPPVRKQDLRCGARDSTRMRSCIPAECEFAQTAIGAVSHRLDSARGCGVCTYTRAGDDEGWGDVGEGGEEGYGEMGRWGGLQRSAGTRRAHKCIRAEYRQTESSAVRTRLDGAALVHGAAVNEVAACASLIRLSWCSFRAQETGQRTREYEEGKKEVNERRTVRGVAARSIKQEVVQRGKGENPEYRLRDRKRVLHGSHCRRWRTSTWSRKGAEGDGAGGAAKEADGGNGGAKVGENGLEGEAEELSSTGLSWAGIGHEEGRRRGAALVLAREVIGPFGRSFPSPFTMTPSTARLR
ncbi:hypothetical protein C8F04DRAFT_1241166 [Mycena alexandri]|uniref:Uncharacterized protein n=1 Tax=Mycena alexandri TaxID=1745969 RepID=A0AAD6S5P1_9AGAR|nr:hypothetical protein C8F04DRAFT_1241166 [Mycena alexandri]